MCSVEQFWKSCGFERFVRGSTDGDFDMSLRPPWGNFRGNVLERLNSGLDQKLLFFEVGI